jgi:hypothetical protein
MKLRRTRRQRVNFMRQRRTWIARSKRYFLDGMEEDDDENELSLEVASFGIGTPDDETPISG